jgi:hypothetical protein
MLNMSKYYKLIVSCSAIATTSIGGFVQSASAAEQFNNQSVRSNPSAILIANGNNSNAGGYGGGYNGSNAGGGYGGGYNGSNAGGGGGGGYNGSNAGGGGGGGYNGSNAGGGGGGGYNGSNAGGGGGGGYNGSNAGGGGGGSNGSNAGGGGGSNGSNAGGGGVKPGDKPGEVANDGKRPTNSSDAGATANGSNNSGLNGSNNSGKGYSSSTIATSKGIQGRFLAAMSKYEIASAALAAAEAGQNNASSSTSPVRYGREPGDIAACGCPNADMSASAPTKELIAAKAAEAEAAAELAAAKAEARQFLESVKANGGSNDSGNFSPIW